MADKKKSGVALSDLLNETATTTVTIGSSEVEFTWKPHIITLELVNSMSNEDDGVNNMARQLAPILVSWNIAEEEGVPFPPTEENLLKVPVDLLFAINGAILSSSDAVGEADGSFGAA